jgi:hypothetical protein
MSAGDSSTNICIRAVSSVRVRRLISFAWSPTEILFSNLSGRNVNQKCWSQCEKKEKGRLLVAADLWGFFPFNYGKGDPLLKGTGRYI